jgi:hypothetical protein
MSKVLEILKNNVAESKRDISNITVLVSSIIPLNADKCPVDSQGEVIPKSQVITDNGTFFPITSRIKHMPDSFVEPRKCNLTLEAVEVKLKSGEMKWVNNVLNAEFELSTSEKIAIASSSGAVLTF